MLNLNSNDTPARRRSGPLRAFLEKISTAPVAVILLLSLLAVLGTVNLLDFPLSVPYMQRISGQRYLDIQGFYTADRAYELLTGFGPAGRETQFLLLFTIDILIPLLSALAGIAMISLLFRDFAVERRIVGYLPLIPLFASLCDYLENSGIFALLIAYPERLDAMASLTGMVTLLKGMLYGVTVLIMIAGLAMNLSAKIRIRKGVAL